MSIETKLFKLNDAIEALRREEDLVAEELRYHRHIDDDAQRDAAVSDDWQDRSFARDTSADVARFEKALAEVVGRRERLERKRGRLLSRLGDL
ncbi:MAG: hypothetical protein RI637_09720 [Acidimicrobiia bacterium]|nr:hypothetical protein [Acidimicrobiia bacterium]